MDFAVVLAQDAVYRPDGSRDDAATHFYVSNDYVLDLAKRSSKVLAGCSINPIRSDALEELERRYTAGSRLIKIHTAIQGVDPERREFDPFYGLARQLGMVLMFHNNLYGDTEIMASMIRWFSLRRLSREPDRLRKRIVHGSDYPFPPARLPYVFRTGLLPAERANPLDLDLCIKRTFRFGEDYESRILSLLNIKNGVRAHAAAKADRC